MVSVPEELRAREAAARQRVEDLQAEAAELALRLEEAREYLSRLEITREAVAQVLADLSAAEAGPDAPAGDAPAPNEGSMPHGSGVTTVPPWREGLAVAVLPGVYRGIVEVIANAPGPVQAKQIVPRIGLPTTTGKIEGTRSKLKRLVERNWLGEDAPGLFTSPVGTGREPVQLTVTKGLVSVNSEAPTKPNHPEQEPTMEPYDALPQPDPYSASRNAFERLTSALVVVSVSSGAVSR
ncbi:hypothetical protein [Streptomyces sp. NPDC017529]|uniref:hypothetical protein n=1 Tax=Streptomyces sp. NPDC017529 TaxID=3365000 RepID=UPI003791E791